MVFSYDPVVAHLLETMAIEHPGSRSTANDIHALRAEVDLGCVALLSRLPDTPEVDVRRVLISGESDDCLMASWYRKKDSVPRSAVVYAHGGGMIAGSVDIYDPLIRQYVELTGVPFLAVSYGVAPVAGATGLSRDVFRAVLWVIEHAAELGVDPARIAVMGDSGGGGVAAGAAIRARDANVQLARQILIYPMLDDRNIVPNPALSDLALWTYDQNRIAWSAASPHDGPPSAYIAPARLEDFAGLAPAFIEVGELDIFRDESIVYASRLLQAGVSCELIVQAGIPHGAEWYDFGAVFSRRMIAERVRAIRSF
jgi:acetyl esterase/lipase